MKLFLTSLICAAFLLTAAAACQTAAPTAISKIPSSAAPINSAENYVQDDAPRITLADAKKDFDAGNVVFIDTRGADSYKSEHIKGAINIPANELQSNLKKIPANKKIIAYCS